MKNIRRSKITIIIVCFLIIAKSADVMSDLDRKGIICTMEDGYDYGYSFNNGEVVSYKFIVTNNKVLSNIELLGQYNDKMEYLEWKTQFSGRIFWFRLNKMTNVLTTESKQAQISFNHQCQTLELMEWNQKLSKIGDVYQFEYDKYLKFSEEYSKELKLN